jgi:hypothetical protein
MLKRSLRSISKRATRLKIEERDTEYLQVAIYPRMVTLDESCILDQRSLRNNGVKGLFQSHL